MNEIVIAIASNDNYFFGLCATISSIRETLPGKKEAKFLILDGGISDNHWSILEKLQNRSKSNIKLHRIPIELKDFDSFPQDWGSSKMAYARLLLPKLTDVEKLIYIDSDVVVLKDLTEIWKIDLGNKIAAASPDPITPTLGQEFLPLDELGLPYDAPYLQSGVMLIDMDNWRKEDISQATIDYIKRFPKNARFWDQSALNITLFGKWIQLDTAWNYPAPWYNAKDIDTSQVHILHYVGPSKPWQYQHSKSKSSKLFYKSIDQTPLKGWRPSWIRNFLKTTKYKLHKLFNR